jgi:hypothetical protein
MNGPSSVEPVKQPKSINMKTTTLQEDPLTGDLYIELSKDVVLELGWDPGDIIEWIDNKDGSWTLGKYTPTMG